MNERLRLDVWMDGLPIPAGALVAHADDTLRFSYNDDYFAAGGGPLSLSFPLGVRTFGDLPSRAFFGNLLPENNQIQRIREREGLEANDVAGILYHMGADCSGAISCVPAGSPSAKIPGNLATDYIPLSDNEIAEIMVSLADHARLPDATRDPSPLAGVQGKLAITVLPDGRWALPNPDLKVPTTHILKVPPRGDAGDAKLEEAACILAREVGFETSVPTALRIADREGMLITRFDRLVHDGVVTRVHQEDFTQALGLPASLKYQRKGEEGRRFYAPAIADLLAATAQPAKARETFLLATLFHLAVGNSDNHGKNHGLLYSAGNFPLLSPLYDILPVRMIERYTHQLAFDIGTAKFAEDITAVDFIFFFETFGLRGAGLRRFVERAVRPMLERLEAASANLPGRGLKSFDDFIGQELERLSQTLEIGMQFRERDYFTPKGGGWTAA